MEIFLCSLILNMRYFYINTFVLHVVLHKDVDKNISEQSDHIKLSNSHNLNIFALKSHCFLLYSTYSNLWRISLEFQELIKMYKFAADLLGSRDVADSTLMVQYSS